MRETGTPPRAAMLLSSSIAASVSVILSRWVIGHPFLGWVMGASVVNDPEPAKTVNEFARPARGPARTRASTDEKSRVCANISSRLLRVLLDARGRARRHSDRTAPGGTCIWSVLAFSVP